MSQVIQGYPFKIPQTPQLRERLDWLQELSMKASHQLLSRLWTDEWLKKIANSKKKAYKVIDENQVELHINLQAVYLPSRIRRCIAEVVGRILRSQTQRKECYYDVLQVVQQTGVEGNLDDLVRIIGNTLVKFYGKYYRWALLRQFLRTIRRYYYKLGVDLAFLQTIPYTTLIKPKIHNFIFPYAPDDGQALKIKWDHPEIYVEMKLPTETHPKTRQEWQWNTFILKIPSKIHPRIQGEKTKLHLPTLRYITLKGGLELPKLQTMTNLDMYKHMAQLSHS